MLMIPEAKALLSGFRSKPHHRSHIEAWDVDVVTKEAALTMEEYHKGLAYLHENGYTESGAIGEFLTPKGVLYMEESGEEESEDPSEFAYERDLQNFLAKNLSVIEPGLRLFHKGDDTGIEFPAGGRSIDILAIDTQNCFVVIELKVSKGYDRAVGQLLRYMGWIKKHLAEPGQFVRGIIVAREISEDLRYACSCVPTVALREYQLSVTMRQVEPHSDPTSKTTVHGSDD